MGGGGKMEEKIKGRRISIGWIMIILYFAVIVVLLVITAIPICATVFRFIISRIIS